MTRQNENIPQSNTDKATARPWYSEDSHSGTIAIYTASRTVGAHVASLPKPSHENGCTPREQAANAALIVTAVNEHEALKAVEVAAKRAKYLLACNFDDLKKAGLHQSLEVQEARELISRVLDNLAAIRGAK